ncbi:hypothetical protein BASA81_003465 [Batrachochytrium salamandrivorans]|nr:hypothetical protein BASA81_003465 [Batrachochytrium salamandrivorans]
MWWLLFLPLSAEALVSPSASPVFLGIDITKAPFIQPPPTRKPTPVKTKYPTRYPTKTNAPSFPPIDLIPSDTTVYPTFLPSPSPSSTSSPQTTDSPSSSVPSQFPSSPSSSSSDSPTAPPLLVVSTPTPSTTIEAPGEAVVETVAPAPVASASYAWFAVLVLPAICLGILIAKKKRAERRQTQLVESVAQIWTGTKQYLVVV